MARTGGGRKENVPGLAARRAAVFVLEQVLRQGRTLTSALEAADTRLSALESRDRALAGHLARTVLRRLGQIDDALARFLSRPLPKRAERVRTVLRAGVAQILFMRVPAHAAVDLSVRLVREDHPIARLSGLANAVLRNVLRNARDILAGQDPFLLNVPEWLRHSWTDAWGEEAARAMAEALLAEPALDLTVRQSEKAAEWAAALGGALLLPTGTIRIREPQASVPRLPGFSEGAWWAQDAAAALPARLLGDVRGRNVLDLCAAPGGKTAQLASAGAHVTAVDASAERLQILHRNLERLRLAADVVQADVLEYAPPKPFEAVLLDAPCSATGTARRHPEVLHLKTARQVESLARQQERMLDRAAEFVAPGGRLVYCTCSLQTEEGEERARAFLQRQGARFRLCPVTSEEVGRQAHFVTEEGFLRTLPHMPVGTERYLDGFFAARFERTE